MPRVHTQIAIADPHILFRRGLRTVLSNEPDFHVTGDESTLDNFFAKLPGKGDVEGVYPDALLVCEDLIAHCSAEHTQVLEDLQSRSVVLALVGEPSSGLANGIAKGAAPADIILSVRKAVEVRRSGFSYSLTALQRQTEEIPQVAERTPSLTARETEIVRFLAEGLTARDTARELSLSVKTVEAHKLNVMRKLGLHKRAELVRFAEQNGLVHTIPA